MLIKAVAQAVLVYLLNIFKFPTSICKEFDSLVIGFWWGQNIDDKKIHWLVGMY